jgi:tryptophanyl-tRNA synthetase
MSLTSPLQKMSKSHPNPLSRILITDSPQTIQKNISSAMTDSLNSVSYDPIHRPGVSNLLTLMSCFDEEGRSAEELGAVYEGKGVGLKAFKELVAESVSEGLNPVRTRYAEVRGEGEGFLEGIERRGARVAAENAEETMVRVRQAVGL